MILSGKEIAEDILSTLAGLPKPEKFLAGILVGNDPASASFQNIKKRTADRIGWDYRIYELKNDLSKDELRAEIGRVAAQKSCGGVVVQLPLPGDSDAQYVLNAIPPEKDPDVLSERSLGSFYADRSKVLPPAAAVVAEITARKNMILAELNVAVVGRGTLVGRPIAVWLLKKTKELFVLGQSSDKEILKRADLVILGAGRAGIVNAAILKEGAGVIDFGYASENGALKGDLQPENLERLSFYTPTPGGTGPILVAKLFQNFHILNSGQ